MSKVLAIVMTLTLAIIVILGVGALFDANLSNLINFGRNASTTSGLG
jgi:hypothetical protein